MWWYSILRMGIAPKQSLPYNQEWKFAILAFTAGWILKSFAQLTEFKGNLTYAHTQTHPFFKKSCLVTNPGGLSTGKNVIHVVNLPLVNTRYVTPFGHYVMTLMLFCLYWMKEAEVFSSHFSLSLPPLSLFPSLLFYLSLLFSSNQAYDECRSLWIFSMYCWTSLANIKHFCLPLWRFPSLQIYSCSQKLSDYFTENFCQCAFAVCILNVK